jgi:hypothetical protein
MFRNVRSARNEPYSDARKVVEMVMTIVMPQKWRVPTKRAPDWRDSAACYLRQSELLFPKRVHVLPASRQRKPFESTEIRVAFPASAAIRLPLRRQSQGLAVAAGCGSAAQLEKHSVETVLTVDRFSHKFGTR